MRFIEKETNPDLANKAGIYQIVNIENKKLYVGSAKNFRIRYNDHLRKLRAGKHYNFYLQNVYNKNNQDLVFSVIEIVEDLSDLISLEQKYLDLFYDNQQNCYNMCPAAGSALGRKHSVKTKIKISLGNKGKVRSEEHNKNMSELRKGSAYQHLNFKSGKENHMYGKTGKSHHFFGKKHSQESLEKMSASQIGKHPQPERCKKTAQYTLEGVFVKQFNSISDAARETGISGIACISDCLLGRLKTAGNHMWRYVDDENDVPLKIEPVNVAII